MTKRVRRRFTPEYKEQAVARAVGAWGVLWQRGGGTGCDGDAAQELEARAGCGRLSGGDCGSKSRSSRAGVAAPRQQAAQRGGGGLAQGLGFFRSVGGETVKARLAFVAAQAGTHSIRFLCRVLGVARSWYHAWQRAAPHRAERAARRAALVEEIRAIFEANKRRYGAPRIHAELRDRGHHLSKRTVAKLMKENSIRPPRKKRKVPVTTDSRHSHAIAPNLLERNFKIAVPDAVWLADISYIPTEEGWLYLAAVKDLATMEIVGWSMSDRPKSALCEHALKMAIRTGARPRG